MEASRLVRRTRVTGGPRRIAARTAAAVAGGALALSGLAFVPAEAGVTDLLGTVTPQIEGSGRITGDGGYLCSATGDLGVLSPCTSLDLGGVLGLTTTTLVPTAADGWEFAGWTDCPDVVAGSCVLDASVFDGLAGSVLEPVAQFVPLPAGGDLSAPDTRITGTPGVDADHEGTETDVEFAFALEGDADEPGFECSLTGPSGAHDFTACGSGTTTGTKRYTGLEPGDYTFSVRALDGDEADPTPARFSWTLTDEAPNTWLRGGPRRGGWLRAAHVAFRLHSDQAGATYRCTLDGRARRCGSRLAVRRVSAGTHTVRAAAVAGGRVDRSPARRTFTRPYDDRALKHGRAWHERRGKGTFLGTYSQTAKKGAALRMRARHITRVALVVSKGRGFGTVKVYLGKRLLKKVPLRAKTLRKRQLVPVERFRKPHRGVVRVVVVTRGRVVRVEGLGIARR